MPESIRWTRKHAAALRALVLTAGLGLVACAAPRPVDCNTVVAERCHWHLGDGRTVLLRADGAAMDDGRGGMLIIPTPSAPVAFLLVARRGAGFWAGRGLAMPAY